MKKGPAILVIAGIALLAIIYFAPYTPAKTDATLQEEETISEENPEGQLSADARVDEAIQQLQSGELPPMQAVLKIRSIAEEHPENLKAQFTLGVMSMQTGQYDKAIERFTKVLEIDPANPEALRMMGQAYHLSGDQSKAAEFYERAIESSVDPAQKEAIEKEFKELNINK